MFGKFFQSKLFTLSALLVIFLLAVALLRIQPQRVVVEKKTKSFQEKISELEQSNRKLSNLLNYFKSDAFLEKEAKLKLNVRRPEEQVVFLHGSDVNPTITSGSDQVSSEKWWQFSSLMRWFKDLFK